MRALTPTAKPATAFLPYLALTVGVLALSLSGIFVRWSQAPGPVTSFYRMTFAVGLLLPVMLFHWRRNGRPPLRWLVFPLLGGLFTALDHASWSTAIHHTRVANATLLNNIAPLWVALFAAFFWRERLTGRFWAGLAVTLLGAGLVLSADLEAGLGFSSQFAFGNGIALLSSLFYAAYFLVTQQGRRHLDVLNYIWLVAVFAALALLGGCLALGQPLAGYDAATWGVFLAAALISQVGGYFAVAYALGRLPASVVSPSMVFQPVLSALVAVPLAGELLSLPQWLGVLAVVGGVYLVNISRAKRL